MSDKLVLNQDETNELGFTIHVQGMSTEPDAAKPIFRFVIFEKGKENANGFIYAGNKNIDSEDNVIVSILPLKGQYSESKEYVGKMEVILGSRYFITATLDISFERPFAIKAELVKKENKPEIQVKVESVNSIVNNSQIKEKQVFNNESLEKEIKEKHNNTVTIDDLDDLSDMFDTWSAQKEGNEKLQSFSNGKTNTLLKPNKDGMVELTKSQLIKLIELKKKAKKKQEMKNLIKEALK